MNPELRIDQTGEIIMAPLDDRIELFLLSFASVFAIPLAIILERISIRAHAVGHLASLALVSAAVGLCIAKRFVPSIVDWDVVMKYSVAMAIFCLCHLVTLCASLCASRCDRVQPAVQTKFKFGASYTALPSRETPDASTPKYWSSFPGGSSVQATTPCGSPLPLAVASSSHSRLPVVSFHLAMAYALPFACVGLIMAILSETYGLCDGRLYGNCFSHFTFGMCCVVYGMFLISLSFGLLDPQKVYQREASNSVLFGLVLVITQHGWPFRFFATCWNVTDMVHVGIGGLFLLCGIGGVLFTSPQSPLQYLGRSIPNLFPGVSLIATGALMNLLPQRDDFSFTLHAVFGAVLAVAGALRLASAVTSHKLNYFVGVLLMLAGWLYTASGDGTVQALQASAVALPTYLMVLFYFGLGLAIQYTVFCTLHLAVGHRRPSSTDVLEC